MRIENWKAKEAFSDIALQATNNANAVMDEVVVAAKIACPVLKNLAWEREGYYSVANVSFTPKRGRNKGQLIEFRTNQRWMGRKKGDLKNTIRRVNKSGSGSVRVYAGNFKIYWAFMVERGTVKTRPQPFLRPSFHAIRPTILDRIKNG